MKTAFSIIATCLDISCFAVSRAIGAPITFVHEGQISGTFAGQPLPLTAIRITAIADTSDLEVEGNTRWIWHSEPAVLELEGLGTFGLLLSTRTVKAFSAIDNGIVSLSHDKFGIWLGPVSPALRNWNMQTSIGPVSGFGDWGATPLETTGGTLVPQGGIDYPTSFRAIVPEPSSLIQLVGAIGFASALAGRRG